MPYDHFIDYDWDEYDPPTKDSPSGMVPLNRFGTALLARILPTKNQSVLEWVTQLTTAIPQIGYGAHHSKKWVYEINDHFGGKLPEELIDLWRYAPGLSLSMDWFLWGPGEIIRENEVNRSFIPELLTSHLLFGGFDSHYGAILLSGKDASAVEWTREDGFTGKKLPSIRHYLAEWLAWYATTFKPFSYQHGFVKR
jgi:hypothetical protein